jgi:gas vesicle protein
METINDQTNQNSKLLRGVVIGGLIGGALALIDNNTRSKVKNTAVGLKDSSSKMYTEVKENPGEVKDQMISQFKSAANTLKEAINDAQVLYQRLNKDVFGNIDVLREISNDAFSTAKEAKSELGSISSKLKTAGTELTENPVETAGLSQYSTGSSNSRESNKNAVSSSSNHSSSY